MKITNKSLSRVFSRKSRLIKPAQYKYVFSKPKRSIDNNFIIIAKKNNENYPRLGLAISKKNIKLAVQRNRIKRIIREFFRINIIVNNVGIDFVVMAKKNLSNIDNSSLKISLNNNFNKLITQLT